MNVQRRIEINNFVREFLHSLNEEEQQHVKSFVNSAVKSNDIKRDIEPPASLNQEQVRKFENVEMPFGIHKGKKIKDVPFDYLCNLLDPNPFIKKLQQYVIYCNRYTNET